MSQIYVLQDDNLSIRAVSSDLEVLKNLCKIHALSEDLIRSYNDLGADVEKVQAIKETADKMVPGYEFTETEIGLIEWKRRWFSPNEQNSFKITYLDPTKNPSEPYTRSGVISAQIICDSETLAVDIFRQNVKELLENEEKLKQKAQHINSRTKHLLNN